MATSELEAAAYPSLDSLANKVRLACRLLMPPAVYRQHPLKTLLPIRPCNAQVTSPKLERVRRIKNRLVRLTTRVETVREVLEKFLDDDEDMHDLNLTANEVKEMAQMEPDVSGRTG